MFRIMWSFKKFAEFCEFLINGGFLFFVFFILKWLPTAKLKKLSEADSLNIYLLVRS